jgi:hypothetical protein
MRELRQYIERRHLPRQSLRDQIDSPGRAVPEKCEARSRCQTRVGSSSINCDLNRDELIKVAARANYTGLDICATAPIHFVTANNSIAIKGIAGKNDLN